MATPLTQRGGSGAASAAYQFTPALSGRVLLVGLLQKKGRTRVGGLGGGWAQRLCALTDHGEIHYFDALDSPATTVVHTSKQHKGQINCREAVVRPGDAAFYAQAQAPGSIFTVQPASGERCYELAAPTLAERDEWIALLSQFGDGPSNAPAKPSAKAKQMLFGDGQTVHDTAAGHHPHKELRTLGVTEAAFGRFEASGKLYRSLGAFEGASKPAHGGSPDESASPSVVAASSAAATAAPAAQPVTGIAAVLAARAAQASPPLPPHLSPPLGTLASGGQSIYTCGWLSKLGGSSNSGGAFGPRWQDRFVVLTTNGLVLYWSSEGEVMAGKTRGVIDANQAVVRYMDAQEFAPPRANVLSMQPVTLGCKNYKLAAATLAERDHWVAALSHFGDGPAHVASGAAVSSKAKDVLYGGKKAHHGKAASGAALDRLGTSQKTVDQFAAKPKAFAKLGIFDDEQPATARAAHQHADATCSAR